MTTSPYAFPSWPVLGEITDEAEVSTEQPALIQKPETAL